MSKWQVENPLVDLYAAKGLLTSDWAALCPCQRECTDRFAKTSQLKDEAYMSNHPEVLSMTKLLVAFITKRNKKKAVLPDIACFFTRPASQIQAEIIKDLEANGEFLFVQKDKRKEKPTSLYNKYDTCLSNDLMDIIKKCQSTEWPTKDDKVETPDTLSSDFISIVTSDTTIPTGSLPTPEPTLEDTMYAVVSNCVDKAVFSNVTEHDLNYDAAYVELMKSVEEALDIPVKQIKEDIYEMLKGAYTVFEFIILENARIAAEESWKRRMSKKLKHSLRVQTSFKGYSKTKLEDIDVTPFQTMKCECLPTYRYNRHRKDRFGVYLPTNAEFQCTNVITTPNLSSPKEEVLKTSVSFKEVSSKVTH